MARVVILGCGRLGAAVGAQLAAAGHQVVGVRRSVGGNPGFPLLIGDLSDADALAGLPRADVILLAATPGLRRGRDHGLAIGVGLLNRLQPQARLVYTSTTAVYADAGGGWVDESGAVGGDDAVRALLAIEAAVLERADFLVLRCPALTGPGRGAAAKVATGAVTIAGDPLRPCSHIDAGDLAAVCVHSLLDDRGIGRQRGILNAAHPQPVAIQDLYLACARELGVACTITSNTTGITIGDTQPVRSLRVDARRLHALLPDLSWHAIASTLPSSTVPFPKELPCISTL